MKEFQNVDIVWLTPKVSAKDLVNSALDPQSIIDSNQPHPLLDGRKHTKHHSLTQGNVVTLGSK